MKLKTFFLVANRIFEFENMNFNCKTVDTPVEKKNELKNV